jgi:creatinine amidohydrolase
MNIPDPKNTMARNKGILLENLTWCEAEEVLRKETTVVIPIGAGSKQHGPHLKLKTDWLLAEYLKGEVLKSADVVIAPTVNYHYYPAFVEYPGSVSLQMGTARDLIVDICTSLARFGPRKYYALNTGVSTMEPLKVAAKMLADIGIEFRYTNILKLIGCTESQFKQQEGGTHADEVETSIMLFIAPSTVDMSKAVKDYHGPSEGKLTRSPTEEGTYSTSGVYGDAKLAARWKGEMVTRAIVGGILTEIRELQRSSWNQSSNA